MCRPWSWARRALTALALGGGASALLVLGASAASADEPVGQPGPAGVVQQVEPTTEDAADGEVLPVVEDLAGPVGRHVEDVVAPVVEPVVTEVVRDVEVVATEAVEPVIAPVDTVWAVVEPVAADVRAHSTPSRTAPRADLPTAAPGTALPGLADPVAPAAPLEPRGPALPLVSADALTPGGSTGASGSGSGSPGPNTLADAAVTAGLRPPTSSGAPLRSPVTLLVDGTVAEPSSSPG